MRDIVSLEKCLIELWPYRKRKMVLVKGGQYSLVKKTTDGFPLYDVSLFTWFRESLNCGESWAFGVDKDGKLQYLFPETFQKLQYKGQVTHYPAARPNSFPKLLIDGIDYHSYQDVLGFFGLEDNWFNRGRVYEWAYRMSRDTPISKDKPISREELHRKFNRKNLVGFETRLNGYGKSTINFIYRGLPVIKGASQLIRVFGISPDDLIWCYEQAGAELPSTAKKYIRELRRGTGQKLLTKEYLISHYQLRREGKVVISDVGENMTFKNSSDLYSFFKNVELEETISKELARDVWKELRNEHTS